MAKTTTKKSKSTSSAKRGNAKTMGDEPFDVDGPPPKKHKDAANRASKYFSTTNKKGYTVNPWSRGSKNFIDVVFHDGGVPAKSEVPNITLDKGGLALRVEWKLPERLFTATQATMQLILVDSAWYNGYCNTQAAERLQDAHSLFLKWQHQQASSADPILKMLKSRRKANHPGPLGQLKLLKDALLRHVFDQREQGITVHMYDLVIKASSLSPEFNAKHFIARCSAVKQFLRANSLVYHMGMAIGV
jgi:hypothetical protein